MRNSKKGFLNKAVALVVVIAAAAGIYVSLQKNPAHDSVVQKDENDTIVAEVNGKPVYRSEANDRLAKLSGQNVQFDKLDDKSKYIVVKELAAHKMVLEEAYKEKIEDKPSIQDRVAAYRDSLVKEEFLASIAKDSINEGNLKARYEELLKDLKGRTQYKLRHIMVESEAKAQAVEQKLKTESFEDVAKLDSKDARTALSGGDLGYVLSGSMIKEFESVIPKMKKGDVSAPIKTQAGWHIVKVEDIRPAEALKFEDAKPGLVRDLFAKAAREYVDHLLSDADIKLLSENADKAAATPEQKTEEAPAPAAEESGDKS